MGRRWREFRESFLEGLHGPNAHPSQAPPGLRVMTNTGASAVSQPGDPDLKYTAARAIYEAEAAQNEPKVVRTDPLATLPTRAYPGDAGYDLYYTGTQDMQIRPGEVAWIPSKVAIEWPPGVWGLIIGRSSSFEKGLLVNPTVIDAGFRGTLGAYVRNVSTGWVTVAPQDRVAQVVPLPLLADSYRMVEVNELGPSERGTAGFGSSGR